MRAAYLAVLAIALVPQRAAAIPYETFIDVDDQSDLEDLLATGDISTDTYNELLDLLETGVDLSSADRARLYALPNLTYEDVDRIIAYREKQNNVIRDPADLVAAGAITEDKLLAVASFLVTQVAGDKLAVKGWLRGITRFAPGDKVAPPFALRGRFSVDKHIQFGFAGVFTRLQIGAPVFDPNRGALIADPREYRVALPKAFVKWETDAATAIAGTYRIGFGQRLTFDNTSAYTPNGLYLDDQLLYTNTDELESDCHEFAAEGSDVTCDKERRVTPDFGWRDGLLGVAAGVRKVDVGPGWLQAYAWASQVRRKIYQYELVNRDLCEDPHSDEVEGCQAPTVFVRRDGPILTPTTRFAFETLPDVFAERLAGANVAYFADRRNSFGAVVYGGYDENLIGGADIDAQEWSRMLTGGRFGAAGANFTFGRDWLDIAGEGAFSFDRLPDGPGPQQGGGGPAGILRVTATKKRQELEATLRYYDVDYANPFSRPISQGDEFEGQRARDETGARLHYTNTANKGFSVRGQVDLWAPVSSFSGDVEPGRVQPKLDTYLRSDWRATNELRLGLWFAYGDRDLRERGTDQCYETPSDETAAGETIPCTGRSFTTTVRADVRPDRTLSAGVRLVHKLLNDGLSESSPFRNKLRQDAAATATVAWRPQPKIRLRGRARYLHEAINDDTDGYLERSLSAYVDGSFALRSRDLLRARVDAKFFLDHREATLERDPNPELILSLSYEARL